MILFGSIKFALEFFKIKVILSARKIKIPIIKQILILVCTLNIVTFLSANFGQVFDAFLHIQRKANSAITQTMPILLWFCPNAKKK